MSKTAMQELIENLDVNIGLYGLAGNKPMGKAYNDIRARAIELLEKEKEQIETAYLAGWGNSSDYHAEHKEEITDEQYYTQTFTQ